MFARRLVIFTETEQVGGAERAVADVAEGLSESGDWKILFAGNVHPELDAWLTQRFGYAKPRKTLRLASYNRSWFVRFRRNRRPTIRSFVSNDSQRTDPFAPPAGQLSWPKALVTYSQMLRNVLVMVIFLRRLRPEALLVNNGGYPGARACQVAPIAARLAGVPQVVSFVHHYAVMPTERTRIELAWDRLIDNCTTHWVTASSASSDRLAHVRGIRRSKVSTVFLGQDVPDPRGLMSREKARNTIGAETTEFVIFDVGILWDRKGQRYAVEALAMLRKRGVPARLVLIGEGEDRETLQILARQMLVSSFVSFMEFRPDVEALMPAADVLLSASSELELLPYVIKEAMAQAVPVVATDAGATSELVLHGVTGILVPVRDSLAISNALESLYLDPDLRKRLGAAGFERISEVFTMAEMTAALQILLKSSDS